MKIIISPDKFKGSLSALQVCEAIHKGIKRFDSAIETILHPLADGGEGTLDVLDSALDLETIDVEVNDPLFRPIMASYKKDRQNAYIEMAAASGLPLLKNEERNCLHTTTFGTGELILDAISRGVKRIYLLVGGSATNDAGIGMATALGYTFWDQQGKEISPVGNELIRIKAIDSNNLKVNLSEVEFFVICDVKNTLFGKEGAAYMYAGQKGADEEAINHLDKGLEHFSRTVQSAFGMDISGLEGGGAAGGIGAGAAVFLKAQILPGIQTVLEVTGYKEKLKGVDFIITGEGKLDEQTIQGKVIHGVDDISRANGIPYAIICGVVEDFEKVKRKLNAVDILQVKSPDISLDSAINDAAFHVENLAYELIKNQSAQLKAR
ncbi:glycerate kinase [Reichenbachiella sp. MALMAid0571]|uniref:glycerate kinase n=1 Tax=Reichenbachiella sp. MALMAid0571 TaxID=3143939 RepID=UPI0032DF981D